MKKNLLILIIITLFFGAGLYFLNFDKNGDLNSSGIDDSNFSLDTDVSKLEEVVAPNIEKINDSLNTYIHKKYNFSFDYPSSFKTSNFMEGEGEQIQFHSPNGDWFQIYITPWDEGENITPERIKKDLPKILINNPQQVVLGPKQKDGVGARALIFFSRDESLGDTREVWFVVNGYLYQITTYKKLDTVVGKVLSTLVFI